MLKNRMAELTAGQLLEVGRNCWRKEPAGRVALLVDGADYFTAFRAACLGAQHVIRIVGWDIHSRLRLVDGTPDDGLPAELGPFLNALLRRRHLRIDILIWDFAMIYSIERESLPLLNREWNAHRRLRLRFANDHPIGASHHQKMVLIDDAMAFVGGMDLTMRRWDTSEHRPRDPRRVDPAGQPYQPFHDLQLAVDGPAAAAIAELARERWRRAVGEPLPPVAGRYDRWPAWLAPDLTDTRVGIARTDPGHDGHPEIREVQQLWCDAIASAARSIYIENQYFTASCIADALARRLAESRGPEIVIVLPRHCHGWLEQTALADCQARLIRRLRAADRFGRLRFYYPVVAGEGAADDFWVRVHGKALVVDDRLARVGSSNLSNRSMGVDTECDIAIEADDERTRRGVARFRERLLAEHLGRTPADVASATSALGLIGAIERLGDGGRTLRPVEAHLPADPLGLHADGEPDANVFDPERPIRPERFLEDFLPEAPPKLALWRRITGWTFALVFLAALVALWRYTPLAHLLTLDGLLDEVDRLRGSALTPLWVLGGFVFGGFFMIPVMLMIAAAGVAFGPFLGFAYAAAGAFLSATVGFGIGRTVGRELVRRIAGKRLNAISLRLAKSGIVTVTALRLLPIAPFTIVNIVAGAMHLRFRDFFAGTALGMAPGILSMTLLGVGAERVLRTGDAPGLLLFLFAILALAALSYALQRWLGVDESAVVRK